MIAVKTPRCNQPDLSGSTSVNGTFLDSCLGSSLSGANIRLGATMTWSIVKSLLFSARKIGGYDYAASHKREFYRGRLSVGTRKLALNG
jgi:hypothetical protein